MLERRTERVPRKNYQRGQKIPGCNCSVKLSLGHEQVNVSSFVVTHVLLKMKMGKERY